MKKRKKKGKMPVLLVMCLFMGIYSNLFSQTVPKKPLFEVFTSSTCYPCTEANQIISGVLSDSPGNYSLIKYQMNWPGHGDIYYTEQGGVRKEYYNVGAAPELYGNGLVEDCFEFNQSAFDNFASMTTAMSIAIDAFYSDEYNIEVTATINPLADYDAGLKVHIVIVEKTTTANIAYNGETEFHNVMMAMLPNAGGTSLGSLAEGVPVNITETFDMESTNMEDPTDLAAIVFVQDDSDKSIVQSEMIDIMADFPFYNTTFNVVDDMENPVNDAEIFLRRKGINNTNADGVAIYDSVYPGNYYYEIKKSGLLNDTGSFEIVNQDITVNVALESPNYLFYEDFGNGTQGWELIYSENNRVYEFDGILILFMQYGPRPLMAISPQIEGLENADKIIIKAGNKIGDPQPSLHIGTVSDPQNPESFSLIDSISPPASGYQDFEIDISHLTSSDLYLAFEYAGSEDFGWIEIETITVTSSGVQVEEKYILQESLFIFPNPTYDFIEFDLIKTDNSAFVEIYDNQGQVVYKGQVADKKIAIHNLEPGVYLIKVKQDGKSSLLAKFIKM